MKQPAMHPILSLDDNILGYHELRQDPAFHYLRPADHAWYINRSLAIGRDAASESAGATPWELVQSMGVRVIVSDAPMEIAGERVRSEYDSSTRTIAICRNSVAQIQALLNRLSAPSSDYVTASGDGLSAHRHNAIDLHIAHELFHHLEATRMGMVDEVLPRVTTRRFGPFILERRRIRRCREIAAHKFVKDLVGLPFLPNAIDWLLSLAAHE